MSVVDNSTSINSLPDEILLLILGFASYLCYTDISIGFDDIAETIMGGEVSHGYLLEVEERYGVQPICPPEKSEAITSTRYVIVLNKFNMNLNNFKLEL